jgi:hypothetical protein
VKLEGQRRNDRPMEVTGRNQLHEFSAIPTVARVHTYVLVAERVGILGWTNDWRMSSTAIAYL